MMSFIIENNNVISFAEFDDVLKRDQRIFDNNEGITDELVEEHLIQATAHVLTRFRAHSWWTDYYLQRRDTNGNPINTLADIPSLDVNRIVSRQELFTELAVYTALAEYTLPMIADFGAEDSDERNKMDYYSNKADRLFGHLISLGDWYDFDDDGTIASSEKEPGHYNLKRIR
jgi:hypothetical protein